MAIVFKSWRSIRICNIEVKFLIGDFHRDFYFVLFQKNAVVFYMINISASVLAIREITSHNVLL